MKFNYKSAIAACGVSMLAALSGMLIAFTACDEPACNHDYEENKCVKCGDVLTSEGLAYELNEDGQSYKLTGFGSFEGKHINVPETYNGKPITTLGDSAFYFDDRIYTIVLPETLTTIEQGALAGTDNLTDVRIPASVTEIGSSFLAFSGYYEDQANWRNGVLYLPAYNATTKYLLYANEKTLQKEVTVEDGTIAIAKFAFSGNGKVEKVTLPQGVTKIDDGAFQFCTALQQISMPDSVTYIGDVAFDSCYSMGSITLSKNVAYIGERCFHDCVTLNNIEFGNEVRHIGKDAFSKAKFYEDIENWVGNTFYITSQDQSVKYLYCAGVYEGYLIDSKTTLISDNALTFIGNVSTLTIPKSVKAIGKQAFAVGTVHKIVFEDSMNWTANGNAISSDELKNEESAAKLLQQDFCDFEWMQK